MSIGIDYTPAHEQGGGIGRYVRELTAALAKQDSQTRYKLFIAGAQQSDLAHLRFPSNFSYHPTRIKNRWLARIWHRARLPIPVEHWIGDIALFHATDFVLPPTRPQTRTILTVHDLSFVRTPEAASPKLRAYLNRVVPRSVARANHILADSIATKNDLVVLYQTPAEKITVLLSGVSPHFAPITDRQKQLETLTRYHIPPDTPYIFTVGTVQPRKNYARLIAAIAALHTRNIPVNLVIAGGRGWLEDEAYTAIETHAMQDAVRFIGYADDADLPTLYSAAACSAFVSLYEGFGLPILESMACGTPIVVADNSSLPEVAGDAAPLVDPTNITQITDTLQMLLQDTPQRTHYIQNGYAQVQRFTWEQSARTLTQVYTQVLNSKPVSRLY